MQIHRRHSIPTSNGYARVTARMEAMLVEQGHEPRCRVHLTLADEEELRDGTELQLGTGGLCAARASTPMWRRFLVVHFERKGIDLAFGAETRVAELADADAQASITLVRRRARAGECADVAETETPHPVIRRS